MHMWDEENPRVTRLRNYQVRWKLNVWTGIMDTKILGPVILPERLTGASYTEFLAENLPDFLEEIPLINRNKIMKLAVRDYFDQELASLSLLVT